MNIQNNMKGIASRFFFLCMMILCSLTASAQIDGIEADKSEKEDIIAGIDMRHWNFDVRAGYSIGGTMPRDFPAEMRGINSFAPKFNYRFGVDVEYRFNPHWGLFSGIYFESKGFKGDAVMKGFDVSMKQGTVEMTGPYFGNVEMNLSQTGLTIPVQASWYINRKLKVRGGLYISILSNRQMSGYAYGKLDENGNATAYIRKGDIRGELVEIGDKVDNYDKNGNLIPAKPGEFTSDMFEDYMRVFQWGVDAGLDWYFSRHWGAFADVSYGLNAVFNDKPGNPINLGLYPLYGTFGIVYKIGR
ncbi:MAG: PorT family protein [Prevotella sp.]|nr:PorT family protein [Candidatus Prevotella equi]